MSSDPVLFSVEEQGIALIQFNRPEVRNAINRETMTRLSQIIDEIAGMPELRVVVITGVGTHAFSSGGDVRDLIHTPTEQDGLAQHDLMAGTLQRLANLPIPVIAALEGATRGGGSEIMLAADLRVAADDSTLAFSQVHMGITPGWGGAQRIHTLLGYKRAFEVLLTGRVLNALEAEMIGLVNRTTRSGMALRIAMEMAYSIALEPPLAVRGLKEVMRAYQGLSLEAAQACEREVFARLWGSADHIEAMNAFLEKRSPMFRGE